MNITMTPDRTTPPPVNRVESITLPSARTTVLGNGMRVVAIHDPSLEITRVALSADGGTADAANPAVPCIAGRIQAEGTPELSGTMIAELIDANGSWMSNVVATHHSTTTFYALPSRLERVLPVMADIIFRPVFPAKELELAIAKSAANARLRESTVRYQSALASNSATFGASHPMARPISPEHIESVTRHELIEFRSRFSSPAQMTLFLTGNIDSALETAIDRHFGSLPSLPTVPIVFKPFSPETPGVRTIHLPHARQSAVTMTIPAVPRSHPDYILLRLTLMALGGYFGSRLSQRIREELGLTYGISAALLGYEEGGVAQIATECNSDSVERLIDETKAEIRRLALQPPSREELSRICQAETASLLEVVETPFSVTEFYQAIHHSGQQESYFYDRLKAARTITADTISRMASTYLDPDRLIISVAAP